MCAVNRPVRETLPAIRRPAKMGVPPVADDKVAPFGHGSTMRLSAGRAIGDRGESEVPSLRCLPDPRRTDSHNVSCPTASPACRSRWRRSVEALLPGRSRNLSSGGVRLRCRSPLLGCGVVAEAPVQRMDQRRQPGLADVARPDEHRMCSRSWTSPSSTQRQSTRSWCEWCSENCCSTPTHTCVWPGAFTHYCSSSSGKTEPGSTSPRTSSGNSPVAGDCAANFRGLMNPSKVVRRAAPVVGPPRTAPGIRGAGWRNGARGHARRPDLDLFGRRPHGR